MPRHARLKGELSVYHIIQRGNERKNLFFSDDDRFRFIETLLRMKKKMNFSNNKQRAFQKYMEFVGTKEGNQVSVMDVEEPMGEDNNNGKFIKTMQDGRVKIKEMLERNEIRHDELNNHIDIRNELMTEIRRNSSLTLKQIGELCGGVSESRVSRILTKLDG